MSGQSTLKLDAPILAILFNLAIDNVGRWILSPVLPLYLQATGATPFMVRMVDAVFGITQMSASTSIGRLSDRVGQKPILVGGLVLSCLLSSSMAFCETYLPLLLVRALIGIAESMGAVSASYIVRHVPNPEDQSTIFRYMGQIGSVCAGIGAGLGSVLYDYVGWMGLCFVMSAICGVEAVIGALCWSSKDPTKEDLSNPLLSNGEDPEKMICNTREQEQAEKSGSVDINGLDADPAAEQSQGIRGFWKDVHRHFMSPKIGWLLWSCLLSEFAFHLETSMFVFVLEDRYNWKQPQWSLWMAQFCVCYFGFSMIMKHQIQYLGERAVLMAHPLLMATSVTYVVFGPQFSWNPQVLLVTVVFNCASSTTLQCILNRVVPAEKRGEVDGLMNSVKLGASLAGQPIAGILYQMHWQLPFALGGVAFAFLSILMYLSPIPEHMKIQIEPGQGAESTSEALLSEEACKGKMRPISTGSEASTRPPSSRPTSLDSNSSES